VIRRTLGMTRNSLEINRSNVAVLLGATYQWCTNHIWLYCSLRNGSTKYYTYSQ